MCKGKKEELKKNREAVRGDKGGEFSGHMDQNWRVQPRGVGRLVAIWGTAA